MPPINVSQNARLDTLVFDNVPVLQNENHWDIMQEQLRMVFDSTEYAYFTSATLDAGKKGSFEQLYEELGRRIGNCTLLNTSNEYLLVFYEAAETLTQERLTNLLDFIDTAKKVFPFGDVLSLICVDKTGAHTVQARDNTLQAAKKLETGDTTMLLFETVSYASCMGNVRALARYIHVLSRNNALAQNLNNERQGQLAYAAMSEFDVQGCEAIQQRLNQINSELSVSESFPVGILQRNFDRLVADEANRFKEFAKLSPGQVPVPDGMVSKRLFGGAHNTKAEEKLKKFGETLSYTYSKGIWESYKAKLEERGEALCRKLVEGISVGDLPKVKDNYGGIKFNRGDVMWSCSMSPVYSHEDLMKQIGNQIRTAVDRYAQAVPQEVFRVMEKHLSQVLSAESIEEKREPLAREAKRLQQRVYPGVVDAKTFWGQVGNIIEGLLKPLRLIHWKGDSSYVLISNDIATNWSLYAPFAYLNGNPVTSPYNCHMLDDQEFQILQMRYFSYEQLNDNKNAVFVVFAGGN